MLFLIHLMLNAVYWFSIVILTICFTFIGVAVAAAILGPKVDETHRSSRRD